MLISSEKFRQMIIYGRQVLDKDHRSLITRPLLDPVSPERLAEPIEGGKFDLTLAEVQRPGGDFSTIAEIGVDFRNLPAGEVIKPSPRESDGKLGWYLPGEVPHLLVSLETCNMPLYLNGVLLPRTSYFRSFGSVCCSDVSPNYQGLITVQFTPFRTIWLGFGARFIALKLEKFGPGDVDPYLGVYGADGFTVTTEGQKIRGY